MKLRLWNRMFPKMNFIQKLLILLSLILFLVTGCKSQVKAPETVESESWTRQWGSEKNDIGLDIVVTNTGIYITGVTVGNLEDNKSAGDSDIFLTKYNFEGDYEWTVQWGTPGRDRGNGVGADSTGIYVSGYVNGSVDNNTYYGKRDLFLTKLDFNGIKLWTIQLGTTAEDYARGLSVDSSGIYITGSTNGSFENNSPGGKDDIFLTKFNTNGVLQWIRQWGTEDVDWGTDVSVCDTGVYVTGFTKGNLLGNDNSGFNDIFLSKYDTEGKHQWTKLWGSKKNDEASSIVSNATDIYVTGRTTGNLDGNRRIGWDDIFLTKFDPTGKKHWTVQFGTKGSDNAKSIAMTNTDIYIIGNTIGGFKNNENLGASDIYLANYNLSGEKQWVMRLGSRGFDYGNAIALNDSDIYISGDSSYGPDDIRNIGDNRDVFLEKLKFY